MTWYYWDPETDVVTPAKYQFMRDPAELYLDEMVEINRKLRENKRVAESYVRDFWISTVFLGLDHGWGMGGDPILFETMILFEPQHEWLNFQDRYCTGKEAGAAHERIDRISRKLLLKAPQISNKNYRDVLSQL